MSGIYKWLDEHGVDGRSIVSDNRSNTSKVTRTQYTYNDNRNNNGKSVASDNQSNRSSSNISKPRQKHDDRSTNGKGAASDNGSDKSNTTNRRRRQITNEQSRHGGSTASDDRSHDGGSKASNNRRNDDRSTASDNRSHNGGSKARNNRSNNPEIIVSEYSRPEKRSNDGKTTVSDKQRQKSSISSSDKSRTSSSSDSSKPASRTSTAPSSVNGSLLTPENVSAFHSAFSRSKAPSSCSFLEDDQGTLVPGNSASQISGPSWTSSRQSLRPPSQTPSQQSIVYHKGSNVGCDNVSQVTYSEAGAYPSEDAVSVGEEMRAEGLHVGGNAGNPTYNVRIIHPPEEAYEAAKILRASKPKRY